MSIGFAYVWFYKGCLNLLLPFHFVFQGIPGHLLLPILEKRDPLEIERLEVSSTFKVLSMLQKNILSRKSYCTQLCTVHFSVTDQLHESALWCINLLNIFFFIFFFPKNNWKELTLIHSGETFTLQSGQERVSGLSCTLKQKESHENKNFGRFITFKDYCKRLLMDVMSVV